ncbi:hypothetical protein [Vibrio crassostreae]|uniref:hypothetical protein n=1 Tax=Vibrio crassostreae TaxID=246167 RepID=UPI001B30576A|nr:hypothetical protein [Vibrio crassostreae]
MNKAIIGILLAVTTTAKAEVAPTPMDFRVQILNAKGKLLYSHSGGSAVGNQYRDDINEVGIPVRKCTKQGDTTSMSTKSVAFKRGFANSIDVNKGVAKVDVYTINLKDYIKADPKIDCQNTGSPKTDVSNYTFNFDNEKLGAQEFSFGADYKLLVQTQASR